ncbi:gamma-glutamyltransferase family protein [Glaciibacter psychrotolerans]|uniref:Gamma-glutamyltranspeptidase/glutathione hydrolase n=1 Tax=Glaciibacter psychrotolerans TaxID=670054 RepID=A0A7Z0EGE7_9MICO|nr:gamma-glutamyltransferase [Leifsonia psychrotolerans]NYJ21075.1 gamma-glutamyltranspeptidase/glutathione hydrolase [Leifsonia psychrotolerans]
MSTAHSTRTARGAIATSHHLATEAGAAALEVGGNALDAALAAAAALCVVYPNNVALGGDLVALVRKPDGTVVFINATGPAPRAQQLKVLQQRHGTALPTRGVDAITVPGGVRGWELLHALGATRSWSEHLDAAVRYAADGVPTARSVAAAIVDERADLETDAGCAAVFLPGGEPLAEGSPLVQPELAASLRGIQAGGPDEFYSGALAARWVAGIRALGSTISLDDTASYRSECGEAIEADFGPYRVLTSPPNTQGFSLLRTLQAVQAQGVADPLGADAGVTATLFARNNAVRDELLADPSRGGLSGLELMEASPLGDSEVALAGRPSGDTVGLSTISADGWAVSLVQSVYFGFGACVLEPSTGILFQNRGTSFSLEDDSPNVFAPGKRPRHTLMPVLVLRGDELAWVAATMGGQAQPQIHAHLLLRSLAGASPDEATTAPRWVIGVQDVGDTRLTATVEADVPEAVRSAIEQAGFAIKSVPRHDELLGHSNLIRVDSDGYTAASDPRSDGSAIVVGARGSAGSNNDDDNNDTDNDNG